MTTTNPLHTRASGVLLHITSLPGPYGIGDFGQAAHDFVKLLAQHGQTYWQVLPLAPTGFADAPYSGLSAFAGNTNLISLDKLKAYGWLTQAELDDRPPFRERKVEFGAVIHWHNEMLSLAYERFLAEGGPSAHPDFAAFCDQQKGWLDDFALFMAIKEGRDLRPWWEWPKGEALYGKAAIDAAREKYAYRIAEHRFRQWLFETQWQALKGAANQAGIKIIGDMPIYVARDSSDVWALPRLFELDDEGRPQFVAGVPPDYFSAAGQLWGNPLYRWGEHGRTGYGWWVQRILRALELVDVLRIDHFRAFYNYWRVPGGEPTAINGKWEDGVRDGFFNVLHTALGEKGYALEEAIIAEDLGDKMDEVIKWREKLGLMGMKILQFAFGDNPDEQGRFIPARHGGRVADDDTIMYTGTHDNSTARGWWQQESSERQRERMTRFLEGFWRQSPYPPVSEPHWEMIRVGMHSNSPIFIAPLQDLLGLGNSARMNTPAVEAGNWQWRCTREQMDGADWTRLAQLTRESGRGRK